MDVYEYLQDKFNLITREDYRNCSLSNNTKKTLCDIGLPHDPFNFIQFNLRQIENVKLDEAYIIIGNDLGTNICVNHRDEIISVDMESEYSIRFINKNLETFLKFIVVILSYENEINEANDDEINQVIQKVRTEFNMIDIQALSSEENWWSIILEQIELGAM